MSKFFTTSTELDYCFGTKDRSNSKRVKMSEEERKERLKASQRKHKGKTLTELGLISSHKVFIENNRMKSNRFYWANKNSL